MEKVLRIVLPLVALVLAYLLYETIARPVRERKKAEAVEQQVKARLLLIRDAQMAYSSKYRSFAPDFTVLVNALKNEEVPVVKETGDPADTSASPSHDTTWLPMREAAFGNRRVNVDSLPFVPMNAKGTRFVLNAGTIEVNGRQVPVFEVYDPDPYKNTRSLRIGSMSEAIYTGNWE